MSGKFVLTDIDETSASPVPITEATNQTRASLKALGENLLLQQRTLAQKCFAWIEIFLRKTFQSYFLVTADSLDSLAGAQHNMISIRTQK